MSRNRLPSTSGRLKFEWLENDVTIYRDRWGIPHIMAQTRPEMYFAQGVLHAQDRLWQLEITRRTAAGTLAAVLGADALPIDRLTRTLGFGRLAKNLWPKLPQQTQEDIWSYTAGINAYLETNALLPVEFRLLKHQPEPWHILDSVSIGRLQAWAMNRGWSHELVRARLQQLLGPDLLEELDIRPDQNTPVTVPEFTVNDALVEASNQLLGKGMADGSGVGSNSWVIGPSKSVTGHPILANDVHLPLSAPGTWYHVHQQYTDGHHVTGASMPGNPHVVIGHNGHIAWGITLAYTDTEDLVVEKFKTTSFKRYEFKGEWERAQIFEEIIVVKDSKPYVEKVVITKHGPIISSTLLHSDQPIALQATSLQDNHSFTGLFAINDAKNWKQFTAAVSMIDAPSLNLLYADQQGNIGHYVSGRVPIRSEEAANLPVPGWEGNYQWREFVPFAEMPHQFNPKQGYILSCNHRLVSDDYTHFLGNCWMSGYRAQRLEQLIQSQEKISPTDCQRWQMDVYSLPAEKLLDYLQDIETDDSHALTSLELLQTWDYQLHATSAAAAVYQVFLRKLTDALLTPILGERNKRQLLGEGPHPLLYPVSEFYGWWTHSLIRMFENPTSNWLPPGIGREAILIRCLRETTAELKRRLGPNPTQWSWGQLHKISFTHAFNSQPTMRNIFNVGPLPIGGASNTLMQTAVDPNTNTGIAAAYRQIIDLSNFSQSLAMHAPGQSEHLTSLNHHDLVAPWLEGSYYPMAYTKEDVDQVRQQTLILSPKNKTPET